MARCCGNSGTGSCACKIDAGRNVTITGVGSSQDPYVIGSDISLNARDTTQFNVTLTGDGTLSSPWQLSVDYAGTATLDALPDVNALSPGNGQVLSWNSSTSKWVPVTPAAGGGGGGSTGLAAVSTDTSLTGDGSAGSPLAVHLKAGDFLSNTVDGIVWNDAAINRTIRTFSNATTRLATAIPPVLNAISLLTSDPGRIDYWNGTAWVPLRNGDYKVIPGQYLAISGSYVAGMQVTQFVKQISDTTAASGSFNLITSADITGYAGILSVNVQPNSTVPGATITSGWVPMVRPGSSANNLVCYAFRGDTGAPLASTPITATVTALLY